MIITQVFSFPVFGRRRRRRRPIYQSSDGDDIWDVDPDDKRRVNDNKNWRRHHPQEQALDIGNGMQINYSEEDENKKDD